MVSFLIHCDFCHLKCVPLGHWHQWDSYLSVLIQPHHRKYKVYLIQQELLQPSRSFTSWICLDSCTVNACLSDKCSVVNEVSIASKSIQDSLIALLLHVKCRCSTESTSSSSCQLLQSVQKQWLALDGNAYKPNPNLPHSWLTFCHSILELDCRVRACEGAAESVGASVV